MVAGSVVILWNHSVKGEKDVRNPSHIRACGDGCPSGLEQSWGGLCFNACLSSVHRHPEKGEIARRSNGLGGLGLVQTLGPLAANGEVVESEICVLSRFCVPRSPVIVAQVLQIKPP
jgi:hypothetical protein